MHAGCAALEAVGHCMDKRRARSLPFYDMLFSLSPRTRRFKYSMLRARAWFTASFTLVTYKIPPSPGARLQLAERPSTRSEFSAHSIHLPPAVPSSRPLRRLGTTSITASNPTEVITQRRQGLDILASFEWRAHSDFFYTTVTCCAGWRRSSRSRLARNAGGARFQSFVSTLGILLLGYVVLRLVSDAPASGHSPRPVATASGMSSSVPLTRSRLRPSVSTCSSTGGTCSPPMP